MECHDALEKVGYSVHPAQRFRRMNLIRSPFRVLFGECTRLNSLQPEKPCERTLAHGELASFNTRIKGRVRTGPEPLSIRIFCDLDKPQIIDLGSNNGGVPFVARLFES